MNNELLAKMKNKLLQRKEQLDQAPSTTDPQPQAAEPASALPPHSINPPQNVPSEPQPSNPSLAEAEPAQPQPSPQDLRNLLTSKLLLLKQMKAKKQSSMAKILKPIESKEEEKKQITEQDLIVPKQNLEDDKAGGEIVQKIVEDVKENDQRIDEEKQPQKLKERDQIQEEVRQGLDGEERQQMDGEERREMNGEERREMNGEERQKIDGEEQPIEKIIEDDGNNEGQIGQSIQDAECKDIPITQPNQVEIQKQQAPTQEQVIFDSSIQANPQVVAGNQEPEPQLIRQEVLVKRQPQPEAPKENKMSLMMQKMRLLRQKKEESKQLQPQPVPPQHDEEELRPTSPIQSLKQLQEEQVEEGKMEEEKEIKPQKIYTKERKIFLKEIDNINRQTRYICESVMNIDPKKDARPQARGLVESILRLQQIVDTLLPN